MATYRRAGSVAGGGRRIYPVVPPKYRHEFHRQASLSLKFVKNSDVGAEGVQALGQVFVTAVDGVDIA